MKASFNYWNPLIRDCKGVITLESTFTGAFAGVPVDRIMMSGKFHLLGISITQVTKVSGQIGSTVSLFPRRCQPRWVVESNIKIRYENYVRPYVEQLQKMGAVTHERFHILVKQLF